MLNYIVWKIDLELMILPIASKSFKDNALYFIFITAVLKKLVESFKKMFSCIQIIIKFSKTHVASVAEFAPKKIK